MPEISTFYGITIRMFNKDHQPPHFHAEYGGKMESIDIRTGRVGNQTTKQKAASPRIEGLVATA